MSLSQQSAWASRTARPSLPSSGARAGSRFPPVPGGPLCKAGVGAPAPRGRCADVASSGCAAALAFAGLTARRSRRSKGCAVANSNAASGFVGPELQSDRLRVAITWEKGLCLQALTDFDVGDSIHKEPPALAVGGGGATREENATQCVAAFNELPVKSREAILGLYCPDMPIPGLEDLEISLSEEERKFLRILAVNGVSLPDARRGVFVTPSRANHSCRPNTAFVVSESGDLSLVAISEIEEGEEITVSYLSETDLLSPRNARQRYLESWGFVCGCPRCSAAFDDVRSMRCGACGDGEVRWNHGGGHQACAACGGGAAERELQRSEGRWWSRYSQLPEDEGSTAYGFRSRRYDPDDPRPSLGPAASPRKLKRMGFMAKTVDLYRELCESKGPCPMVLGTDRRTWARFGHFLAGGIADVAAEAHIWRGEYEEAAAAAQVRRRFVSQALGGAFSYEGAMAAATQGTALALSGEVRRGRRILRDALREAETLRWKDNELVLHIRSQLGLLPPAPEPEGSDDDSDDPLDTFEDATTP